MWISRIPRKVTGKKIDEKRDFLDYDFHRGSSFGEIEIQIQIQIQNYGETNVR